MKWSSNHTKMSGIQSVLQLDSTGLGFTVHLAVWRIHLQTVLFGIAEKILQSTTAVQLAVSASMSLPLQSKAACARV